MTPYDNPDYHALVAAIRQAERDGHDHKLVRLITADWLEEHGEEERAHYIREACEDKHGKQYTNGLAILAEQQPVTDIPWVGDIPSVGGQLRYGSLHWVSCRMNWWLQHGPYLVRRHPITAIHITDKEPLQSGSTRTLWTWTLHYGNAATPSTIPREIHARLTHDSIFYYSHQHAINDLHTACLTYAESQIHSTT